jgi:hypothetical protein
VYVTPLSLRDIGRIILSVDIRGRSMRDTVNLVLEWRFELDEDSVMLEGWIFLLVAC